MSLLETYLKEIEIDTSVDILNVKEKQLRLPAIKQKWVGRFIRHKQELIKATHNKEALQHKIIRETIQRSPVELRKDANLIKQVENTDSIKKISEQIEELKLILELLEKVEKIFSNMTFDFKNIVELQKMETM